MEPQKLDLDELALPPGPEARRTDAARILLDRIGNAALMIATVVRELRRPRAWADSALQQAWVMGIRSLPL
ncbi:MAG TPA: hypothetical protein VF832_19865, partial [Longimicrobiales bacterium]